MWFLLNMGMKELCSFQLRQMRKRYVQLNQTGSAPPSNRVDQKILNVMGQEVDILGDTVGSSSNGIKVLGKEL